MATTIVTKSGSGAPTASDLVAGELAVDLTNKRLYTENSGGTVIEVGSNPYNFTANHDGSAKLATTATGIDVTGTVTADGTASSSVPKYTFAGDVNTGLAYIGADAVGLIAAGSRKFYVNATTGYFQNLSGGVNFGSGINVTGSVTASGNIIPTGGSATAGSIWKSGANLLISMDTGGLYVNNSANTISAFHITDAGNVGIGTSSPFSVNGTNLEVSDALYSRLILDSTAGTRYSIQSLNDSSLGIYDLDADSERLRIDALGNASFNTTDISPASNNVFGTAILQYGGASMSRTNSTTLDLNRSSSDGAIVSFRKDGASVGSIGTVGGVLTIGNGDTGLLFSGSGDYITPRNATTQAGRDAAIDLGTASDRFKDLHLSGGVYLGGTGAANKLDDYEEGTWSPAYTPTTGTFTTITTVGTGRYTKVGRLVTVFGHIYTSGALDVTGASGNLKITGLPFACNATVAGGGADISHQSWNLGTDILNTRMYVGAGTSEILMYKNTMNGSSFPSGNITVADMSTSGAAFGNLITFTASYEV